MKTKLLLVVTCFTFVGCGTSQIWVRKGWHGPSMQELSMTAPIRQSDLPCNPVLRSYRYYSDGTHTYSRNSGSETYGEKYWDPCTGTPRTVIRQSTWDNEYQSTYPRYDNYPRVYTVQPGPMPYIQGPSRRW